MRLPGSANPGCETETRSLRAELARIGLEIPPSLKLFVKNRTELKTTFERKPFHFRKR